MAEQKTLARSQTNGFGVSARNLEFVAPIAQTGVSFQLPMRSSDGISRVKTGTARVSSWAFIPCFLTRRAIS
jgi:hypothetical protein